MRIAVLFALLSVFLVMEHCGAMFDSDELDDQVFIILSFDAFKPQYFELGITPNMDAFRREGCYAPYIIPRFPTKTFVNHFSIATGCNAGSHGVTGNELYDDRLGELKYGYELFHYNASCDPIWAINERNEKHTGCMMWPGSDFPYGGYECSHFQQLDEKMSWEERMDLVIDWIHDKDKPANLVMWYMEQPDSEGHAFSPSSGQQKIMITQVDIFVGRLQQQLAVSGLAHRVNLIIISDHGMETVYLDRNVIDLTKVLKEGTYKMVGTSPMLQVIAEPGHEREVLETLETAARQPNSHFNVYTNENIPKRWHINNEHRLGTVVVADRPYAFQDLYGLAKWFKDTRGIPDNMKRSRYGVHGYDNEDEQMRAIFMAKGPMFKSGQVVAPFDNIDLFQFFCLIVGISCPPTEGLDRVDTWNTILHTGLEGSAMFY